MLVFRIAMAEIRIMLVLLCTLRSSTDTTDTDMAAAMFATTSPLTTSKAIAVHGPCQEDPCTLTDCNRPVCQKEKQLIVKNSISLVLGMEDFVQIGYP